MIELAEVISELRREMQEAMAAGRNEPLRFDAGPIELEATIAVERQGGAGAKIRFYIVELGGEAMAARTSTQRIKLTLQPRVAATGAAPTIASPEMPRER
jgi:hypothetical protein